VLLAEENRQLRHENKRQKRKMAEKMTFIATVQEGRSLSQNANTVLESGVVHQEATIQTRAPRMCSLCRSLLHTARTCPTKQDSN
jgi:hypothetical protein